MNKSTVLAVLFFCAVGYFVHDRYVVKPKKLNNASERMLIQIAGKERWFDVLEVLMKSTKGTVSLEDEIIYSIHDDDFVYAGGKLRYKSESTHICKIVDFKYVLGSLNDYELIREIDCHD